jgi:integrase
MIDRHLRATVLLTQAAALGLDLEDLIAAHPGPAILIPTLAEHVEAIAPTFGAGTAGTYSSYWRLAVDMLGHRRLTEISVGDLQGVVATAASRARQHRTGSTGRSSTENCVAALRALLGRAHAAGLIATNPAAALSKPRRARSRRRALDDTEIAELIGAIRTTSDDPDIDLLLVRFHLETGARRQGALGLHLVDIDPRRSTVWLREKNGHEREQPLSPTLTRLLIGHATDRGARHPDDPIFRRADGRPITARRYDTIFNRARPCLDWTQRTPISAHVLRHTAINNIAHLAGYPTAQTFAGHTPSHVTGRYLQATITQVAAAIATLTGQPHPLARRRTHAASGHDRHRSLNTEYRAPAPAGHQYGIAILALLSEAWFSPFGARQSKSSSVDD